MAVVQSNSDNDARGVQDGVPDAVTLVDAGGEGAEVRDSEADRDLDEDFEIVGEDERDRLLERVRDGLMDSEADSDVEEDQEVETEPVDVRDGVRDFDGVVETDGDFDRDGVFVTDAGGVRVRVRLLVGLADPEPDGVGDQVFEPDAVADCVGENVGVREKDAVPVGDSVRVRVTDFDGVMLTDEVRLRDAVLLPDADFDEVLDFEGVFVPDAVLVGERLLVTDFELDRDAFPAAVAAVGDADTNSLPRGSTRCVFPLRWRADGGRTPVIREETNSSGLKSANDVSPSLYVEFPELCRLIRWRFDMNMFFLIPSLRTPRKQIRPAETSQK